MNQGQKKPDFIFETSWEVCNKVGGIYTVVSTKSIELAKAVDAKIIYIGPDNARQSNDHVEFKEDKSLFASWISASREKGFRIRIGRWQIPGTPTAILIDYTPFIAKKDEIFTELWENYKVDSITGGWDFIEPALFGYAAGQVIEDFCRYNLSPRLNVIANFHEWMTAAGVLYLEKYAPYICTMFTTHATMVGRCIASNNQPLYKYLKEFSADAKAQEFNVVAKHSLEKNGALVADVFTTVSESTALECEYFLGRKVDVLTPNGFEDNFVPQGEEYPRKRKVAREKIFKIAKALTGNTFPDDSLIVVNSGRYEFRNKGIDLFIDSIAELKNQNRNGKKVVALILVPAHHDGPRYDLLQRLDKNEEGSALPNPFHTHNLHDFYNDAVIRRINEKGLGQPEDIAIIFVPCYLNGKDGIFNLPYYDVLIGADLTAFPSYYEPWGYTPLESIAFSIPTITTTLAGFGQWVLKQKSLYDGNDIISGTLVVERNEDNAETVVETITQTIVQYLSFTQEQIELSRTNAKQISNKAQWSEFIVHYLEAYSIGLTKNVERYKLVEPTVFKKPVEVKIDVRSNEPSWRKMRILTNIPKKIEGMVDLAMNVWWSWNYEASQLFKFIDKDLWEKSKKNPLVLLNNTSQERLLQLQSDSEFMGLYTKVYGRFQDYMADSVEPSPSIAYFSMEYGLNDNINIYSGGLGILAGDYLKEASDSRINMVGVGLMYRKGYFTQQLNINGEQIAVLEDQDLNNIPAVPVRDKDGNLLLVTVYMPARPVKLRVWEIAVGRIKLYLLDSDLADNNELDRTITHQLYGGDWENRLKQEIVLGFGGIRLLRALGIESDVYHLNEGHAAFTNLERMCNLIEEKHLSFEEALEVVRHSSLFTTHTPVPAGHDAFSEELMRMYIRHTPERLHISWDQFMDLGRWNPGNVNDKFSMSVLATNLCQDVNGVSELHGKVSREMFVDLYKGYFPEEIHIGHVTNGVHYPTWTAKEWRQLYEEKFGPQFLTDNSNPAYWEKIYEVDDEIIWEKRQILRKKLVEYIKARYKNNWIKRNDNPRRLQKVLNSIDDNVLTIGFARRFATYKRANLLFSDLERLAKLVNNPEHPVQFIFAGKAHPHDKPGQDLIKQIVEVSRRPEFIGKIIFIENYDIQLAKRLVKGVDIWLNTPTRPLEASGTSGMKATLNGVLNCSVLDGWYLEGYRPGAGWMLTDEITYTNPDFQNELDALELYDILENQIIPLFYKRNEKGIPVEWIRTIKNSIAQIAPHYTTSRMINDYMKKYYVPLTMRHRKVTADDYAVAARLASWKKQMLLRWNQVEVISIDFPDSTKKDFFLGQPYHGELMLDLKDVSPNEIAVVVVLTKQKENGERRIEATYEMELVKLMDTLAFYSVNIELVNPGMYEYSIRLAPKHSDLVYPMDFNLVRWI